MRDLVVGDVLDVQAGDRVPADCILLEEANVKVDQSMYNPIETEVAKDVSLKFGEAQQREGQQEEDNHKENPDPFLLAASMVMAGSGKALVCCVGENTRLARSTNQEDLVIKEQQTSLEEKLEELARAITQYAMLITILIMSTQSVYMVLKILILEDKELFEISTLMSFMKIVIVSVCILIVAIPEGLPLAVSIAMALSINKLKNDAILIKNVAAVQTAAMLHDVCVGKSGTITTGKMSVAKYQFCDHFQPIENDPESDPSKFNNYVDIQSDLKQLIVESIAANSEVRIEPNDELRVFEPKGQQLEVAMMQFLIDNQEDVHHLLIARNQSQAKVAQLPFCQNRKRSVVVRSVANDSSQVRIYVKGAPEYVIPLCSDTFDYQMHQKELDEDDQYKILSEVISTAMAKNGLTTLSYAYKQIPYDDLQLLLRDHHPESEEFRSELETDLVYLASFGLEDPLREGVERSVQLIRYGAVLEDRVDRSKGAKNQVNVRMVTGDHIDTALHVAINAGLITEEEADLQGIYMTGEQFREQIGEYSKIWDEELQKYTLQLHDPERFRQVKSRLRIIARATAEDKFLLIAGIKQAGGLVAMTGESVADAMALKEADVGLCMGSGCQVAKDSSDLVILDNDFASIHSSIKWGRAIFDNVRKFLQFQLTINIVLCVLVFVNGATLGQSPLNVIQLLWANLIMDILGAIAICTEPPPKERTLKSDDDADEIKQTRVSRKERIIQLSMWRSILGQAAFQLLVLLFLSYFGTLIFFEEPFNLVTTELLDDKFFPTDRMRMNTMIFHTFILMNLFNQINCRIVDEKESSVFGTICNNFTFWIIMAIELALQNYMVWAASLPLGPVLLGTADLTFGQRILCWVLGALSLAVHPLLRKVPLSKFAFMARFDLEAPPEDNFALQVMSRA